jgi:hypothetical protein
VRIGRQLQWLPYHRRVRNVAGFLLSAIEDDYEMPPSLRRQVLAQGPLAAEADAPLAEQAPLEPAVELEDVPPLDVSSLHLEMVPGEEPGADWEQDEQPPL